jgi:hypothetical protein
MNPHHVSMLTLEKKINVLVEVLPASTFNGSSGNGMACFGVQHDARPTAGGSEAAPTQEHARGRSSERRRRSTRPAWRKPREAVETGQLRRRWGAGTSSVVSRG